MTHNPEALSLAILSGFLTLLPVFAPLAGLLLALLVPFPLLVLGLKYGWRLVLSVLTMEAGFILLLEGWPAIFLLNYYVVVPTVMIAAMRQGFSMSWTIVLSVVAPVTLSVICLGVACLLTQQPPGVLLLHAFERLLQAMQEHVQTLGQGQPGPDQSPGAHETLPELFLRLLPAMVVINHLFTNVFNYVLVRAYCLQTRAPQRLDPEDLTSWRSSDYLVWVFLVSGALVLFPFEALSTLGLNVFLITLMIYCLQGVAIAAFWGRQLPLSPGLQWLLGILVFVLAGPFCLLVCTIMGLFDLWVDFRRQRRRPLIS
jgi:Predicted membrane protein (DUF2232)